MKIVHLVTEDSGGAGRAARRICQAQREIGIDAVVAVLDKYSNDSNVVPICENQTKLLLYKAARTLYRRWIGKYSDETLFTESRLSFPLFNHPIIKSADIFNLHWINFSFISYKGVERLSKDKPVVWTLHDMWPFTAGCYYDEECNGYMKGCEDCQYLKKGVRDYSKKLYSIKQYIYERSPITFVGCSKWISNCAKNSLMLNNNRVVNIPNPIDTRLFAHTERELAHKELGIKTDKKIVLFGAMSSDSNVRKGYRYLKAAVNGLDKNKYEVMIFGNTDPIKEGQFTIKSTALGKISSDKKLALIYSAADVYVAPSIQENLSNAVMESLSCGTPVVAFNIGGMSDMIKHRENGYLAIPFNYLDLANGIRFCSENNLQTQAREIVKAKFSMNVIANQYQQLYRDVLKSKTGYLEKVKE